MLNPTISSPTLYLFLSLRSAIDDWISFLYFEPQYANPVNNCNKENIPK